MNEIEEASNYPRRSIRESLVYEFLVFDSMWNLVGVLNVMPIPTQRALPCFAMLRTARRGAGRWVLDSGMNHVFHG